MSVICLGTMTWGEQNTEQEAHSQLDIALDTGVNFIDAAEIYPVPPREETCGLTEKYIGNWLKKNNSRDKVILTSKVAGRADWLPHVRGGASRLDRKNIEVALNNSLKRLQTDYIDLYQLHWPDRSTNFFGVLGYDHNANDDSIPLEESLAVLSEFQNQGKIRHIGISNETPWGMMRYLQMAENSDLGRIVSIQNPYSLLNRSFEIGLSEIAHREGVGLLAYSPLAFGTLSGKYLGGKRPAGARLTLFDRFTRYSSPNAEKAIQAYVELAAVHDLDPTQMALAYVNSRSFLTSNIIGATNNEQLKSALASVNVTLPTDLLDGIEQIHQTYPNPSP